MYFNNSIFGRVGVGCSVGLLLPVMDFIGMLHPLGVPFLPGCAFPCMAYMGMCHRTGYGFLPLCP